MPCDCSSAIGPSALVPQSQVTTTRGAGSFRGAHAGVGQIVAVLEAARDERHRVAAQRAQRSHHQRRRADAVDVVVAVDEDRLVVAERAHESLDGAIEVEQSNSARAGDRGAAGG